MLNPVSASKNNIVALAFVFPQSYVFVLSVFCIMLVPIQSPCFKPLSYHKLFLKYRGGAAYLYLISILIWPHFDTYPYISIQNILMRAQNILITKIYL